MVSEVDSISQLKWSTVIHKSQADVNRDDFLSYGLINSGGEIQFLNQRINELYSIIENQSETIRKLTNVQ